MTRCNVPVGTAHSHEICGGCGSEYARRRGESAACPKCKRDLEGSYSPARDSPFARGHAIANDGYDIVTLKFAFVPGAMPIASKGYAHDWAVYVGHPDNDDGDVVREGAKLRAREAVAILQISNNHVLLPPDRKYYPSTYRD